MQPRRQTALPTLVLAHMTHTTPPAPTQHALCISKWHGSDRSPKCGSLVITGGHAAETSDGTPDPSPLVHMQTTASQSSRLHLIQVFTHLFETSPKSLPKQGAELSTLPVNPTTTLLHTGAQSVWNSKISLLPKIPFEGSGGCASWWSEV